MTLLTEPTRIVLRNTWQPMDTDAAAYITAVETADGQALEEKTKIAIDNFGTAYTPCANPPCEIEIHYTYRGCYVYSSYQRDIGTLRTVYTKYLYVEFVCTFTCVCCME